MTQTSSLEEVVGRLLELDQKIRTFHPKRGREPGWNEVLRSLTVEEWTMVARAIKEHELPCALEYQAYGFAFVVYEPGVETKIRPALLLYIEDQQFPFDSAKQGFDGQMETALRLEPLTHSERNKELLAWSGFEPLGDPGSYVY